MFMCVCFVARQPATFIEASTIVGLLLVLFLCLVCRRRSIVESLCGSRRKNANPINDFAVFFLIDWG